jgi:uncharacterized membrane protein SpoIIM required for sporulation
MKETDFINQNQNNWANDEIIFDKKEADPDQVSEAFIEITEDLSYARTFYTFRSVRVYLNQLAQGIYFKLNIRRVSVKNLLRFWTDEVPQAMEESRKDMNLAMFIFLFGMLIGVVSTVYDPDFPRIILGDEYVNMTLQNISNGDPMKVYKDQAPFDMFFAITINNLMVAYRVFVMGILFSIGSAVMLFYNAIMIGSFQFFFFQNAVFLESVLAIWLHGTLEISAIILAGGAGLTLGRGLLFPGTLPRRLAFLQSAQRGLKIMLGITPVFIMAAIIESFATRYTDAPNLIRVLIILSSLVFILGYYVWYPWKKSQAGFDEGLEKYKLPAYDNQPLVFDDVKSTGSMFSDAFRLLGKLGSLPLITVTFSALALTLYFLYSNRNNDLLPLVGGDWFLVNLNRYYTFHSTTPGFWLNLMLFTLVVGVILFRFNKIFGKKKIDLWRWLALPVILFFWQLLFVLPDNLLWWAIILITPFVFLLIVGVFDNAVDFKPSRILSLVFTLAFQTLMLTFLLLLVSIILFLVVYTPLMWFYVNVIQINIDISDAYYTFFIVGSITLVLTFVFFMITALMVTGAIILYYNISEAKYADGLLKKIKNIKAKKLVYGLEGEN